MLNEDVIVIIGSNRKNSNTRRFVSDTYQLADDQLIDLLDYVVYPYNYAGRYPDEDQFDSIIDRLLVFDNIVLATPVYWYSMSGLMKTFFDRLTDLVTINKPIGRRLKGKSIKIMAVGEEAELPPGFEVPFKGTAEYFDMHFDGCIYRATKD